MDEPAEHDRYRYGETLGQTNLAVTRLATDTVTGTACVIKSVSLAEVQDEKTLELFRREARVLANLDHPRIPRFLGMFEQGAGRQRTLNLVQEYVPGSNLAKAVAAGRRFVERDVIGLAIQLCRILEYLHAFSPPIIHRDVKPSNIVLDGRGQAFLIDFGGVRDRMMQDRSPHGGGFTIVGSYGYMPYEQFEGRAVPASDIYSLGATLVFLLSHKEPSDLERQGLRLRIDGEINVTPAFQRLIERMIEPDWNHRYQSALEVRNDLERLLRGVAPRPVPRWSRRGMAAAAAIGATILAGSWIASRRSAPPVRAIAVVRPRIEASVAAPRLDPKPAAVSDTRGPAPATPEPALVSEARSPAIANPEPIRMPPSQLVAIGTVSYDGRPITAVTPVEPSFWFRNEDTGQVQNGIGRYRGGSFELYDFPPGHYGMSLRFDAEQRNPGLYPGDFESWTPFTIEEGRVARIEVNPYIVIHLLSPFDNDRAVPGSTECERRPIHPRSLVLAWEPLGSSVYYDFSISRVECPWTNPSVVATGTTAVTSVRLDLTRSGPNDYYVLKLSARRDGRRIGGLLTHGSNFLAWDYRFRVE